ncbi:MAG: FoF1 ATP synthase subunit a [Patescibacteria group bacterium]|nr:FoF1 ATP synthase subunit a [Patescibacteria group bacterium]
MSFLQINQSIPDLKPDVLFNIGGFPVTNTMTLTWLIVGLIIVFGVVLRKSLQLEAKSKLQLMMEIAIEGMIGMLDQITQNTAKSKKMLPIIGSVFLFFILTNVITLVPGFTSIMHEDAPLFRVPTTDLNMTLALAVMMIGLTQIVSMKSNGVLKHIGEYIQIKKVYDGFKKSIGEGFIAIINFAMGFLDIIGEFAKVISLSLRLFGNMFASEVLMVVMMSFSAFVAPSILMAQTLLVGLLQAMVFSILSAVYLNLAFDNN